MEIVIVIAAALTAIIRHRRRSSQAGRILPPGGTYDPNRARRDRW